MIVIDSSVIIKCFFYEQGSEEAKKLVRQEHLCAPDLLLYEFTNYLGRQKDLSLKNKQELLDIFYGFKIEFFILPEKGFKRVIELCTEYNITSYDASFIALAEVLKTQVVTADKKLINTIGKSCNIMKSL
ncbi:MAG: type II toxin-antitoxin system VapC family toxin [bacterium]|nr:type II toxin-antitoxin system VapC family toxin [bacterium]MBU1918026.1 type II toxin-antitoxin system VapC family toxin [bacterium]